MLMAVHMLQWVPVRSTWLRDGNAPISSQKVSSLWVRECLIQDVQLVNRQHILKLLVFIPIFVTVLSQVVETANKVCDLLLVIYNLLTKFFDFVEHILLGLKLCLNICVELFVTNLFDVIRKITVQKQSLLEVRPFLNLLDVFVFLVVDPAPDLFYVEKQAVALDVLVKLWVTRCYLFPVLLPDEEPIRVAWRFVDHLRPPVERALEPTNLVVALKPHFVFYLLIDLVTNVKATVDSEHHHIDILKLCEQDFTLSKSDGL